ncbi:MAG: hypothetical protein QOJ81_1424 [Chloroflexota bacterium]|nr:hypothetical protein [Chloroflexota bacterium]
MTRDEERQRRAREEPIVRGLPDAPGIGVAMRLAPGLGVHLRGLADEVLVKEFAGATISRFEREALATAVSAANDCFFCMDSHAEHAVALLEPKDAEGARPLLELVKTGASAGFSLKMQALLIISRTVQRNPLELGADDIQGALDAGASDADVQLAVLIAAAFSMYNRLVDGFRAKTPASTDPYRARAAEIAARGYSAAPAGATPSGAMESPRGAG